MLFLHLEILLVTSYECLLNQEAAGLLFWCNNMQKIFLLTMLQNCWYVVFHQHLSFLHKYVLNIKENCSMVLCLKMILDWHLGLTKVLNYTLSMCVLGKVLTGTLLFSSSLYLCFRALMKTEWMFALQTKLRQHYGSRSTNGRHTEWLILWYKIFILEIILGKLLMQKSYHI